MPPFPCKMALLSRPDWFYRLLCTEVARYGEAEARVAPFRPEIDLAAGGAREAAEEWIRRALRTRRFATGNPSEDPDLDPPPPAAGRKGSGAEAAARTLLVLLRHQCEIALDVA